MLSSLYNIQAGQTMDVATQEDLIKIKDSILKELNDVKAIYLFGSVAKGTQNENSDYDVLVFVDKYPKNKIKSVIKVRNDVSDHISKPLELFILEMEDLNYPSPFLYEVYNNHRLIYGTNDVIKRCRDIIKNIKPLFMDGIKIGYHV
jgi:predicted nucleotidyltransferase